MPRGGAVATDRQGRPEEKVWRARSIIDRLGLKTEVDGGARRQSVPLIHSAGADRIVPGSPMFGEDPRRVPLQGATERITEIRGHRYWQRTALYLGT